MVQKNCFCKICPRFFKRGSPVWHNLFSLIKIKHIVVLLLVLNVLVSGADAREFDPHEIFEQEINSWLEKVERGEGSKEARDIFVTYYVKRESLGIANLISGYNNAVEKAKKDNDLLGAGLIKVVIFDNSPQIEIQRESIEKAVQLLDGLVNEVLIAFLKEKLGVVSYELGHYEDALRNFDNAEDIYRAKGLQVDLAGVLQNKGVVYLELARYEDALRNLDAAEEIFKAKKMEAAFANIFTNKGNIYYKLGNYEDALRNLDAAEEIYKAKKMEEDRAVILTNKGNVYCNLGRYEDALRNLDAAEEIYKAKKMEAALADIFTIKGIVYYELGLYQDALKNYDAAEEIYKAKGMEIALVGILKNKGNVYSDLLNRYDDALRNYDIAEGIYRAKGMETDLAGILINKGIVYDKLGRHEDALRSFDAAEEVFKEKKMEAKLAIILENKGVVFYYLGRYDDALRNFDAVEEIFKTKKMEAALANIFVNKGLVYEFQGSLEKSIANYKQSIDVLEKVRGKIKTEEIKTSLMAGKMDVYKHLVFLLVEIGKYEDAFHYVERGKARSFLDLLSEREVDIHEGVDEELLSQKNELLRKISFYQKRIIEEPSGSSQTDSLKVELSEVEKELDKLERKIKTESPAYAALVYPEPLNLKSVQKKIIDEETALLEYCITEKEIILWVVKQNTFKVYTVPLGSEKISEMINEYRMLLTDRTRAEELSKYACMLYENLIKPAASDIAGIRRLIIVPDGPLHYLPFQTLKPDDNTYLLKKYLITYAPSASVLSEIDKWRGKTVPKEDLIAFAVQDFGEQQLARDRGIVRSVFRDFYRERGYSFGLLPHTMDEVNGLGDIYGDAVVYVDTQALEFRAKNECSNFSLVHFATHGILDEEKPMYSGVVLSRKIVQEDDGFLQAYEVYNIRLNADLLVLSACRTGLGKLTKGEGLVGLSRAFMYAGSSSLVVSLWSVEDVSTAFLMKQFYSNLQQGLDKDEALRKAQMQLLDSEKSHPLFWAPFVLIGDWK
jgi:CHAT domain-containing protein/Tfp pilus assembly protein PilF